MRTSKARQDGKDIARLILQDPNFPKARVRRGLENYGLTLANHVCERLKTSSINYNSPHYTRILDTLYDHFEKYEVALDDLDIMVEEVEKVLYGDLTLEEIMKRQKSAGNKAFKRELGRIALKLNIDIKNT